MTSRLLPALLLLGAAACREGTTAPVQQVPAGAAQVSVRPLDPQHVELPLVTGVRQRTRLVVRSNAEWRMVWTALVSPASSLPVPWVDFGEEQVLIAAMGEQPTGGYGIAITGVFDDASARYVVVESRTPGSGCGVTQVVTSPAAGVIVPRRDGPVRWVEHSLVTSCQGE